MWILINMYETDHIEDTGIDRKIILKRILTL
jgi:hypothetical protein